VSGLGAIIRWQLLGAWIPAFAGMTFHVEPTHTPIPGEPLIFLMRCRY
jgi:hypothetical protein